MEFAKDLQGKAQKSPPAAPQHVLAAVAAAEKAKTAGDNGNQFKICGGKLKTGTFEVRASREDITAAEIGKIIKVLEAQEAILRDDEPTSPNAP